MIAAILEAAQQAAPGPDWVAIIGALGIFVTTCCTSVAGLVVAIRNGKKADGVLAKVEDVHDCLHRQAENVSALITATPGVEEAK